MVLQALRLGFSMGTQSPKANGLLQYINTTQREKIDALDERIAEEAGALKAQVSDAFDEGAKCTENGFGYVDEACTSDNVVFCYARTLMVVPSTSTPLTLC